MKTVFAGGALALLGLVAHSAQAQTIDPDSGDAVSDVIYVESPLLHPSAGLMHDHMHRRGEGMVGIRFERQRSSGANVSGTDTIADADILAAGYTVRSKAMEMDMVMLDLMYAPSDKVTLMAMPHYMWHRMQMVGIDPDAMPMDMGDTTISGGGHAGHGGALGYGEVHAHETQGFGDTLVSASYLLAQTPAFRAHATLGLWVPTGSVEMKNADGSYVHYGMQPGSGTWDLEPVLTIVGANGPIGWGVRRGRITGALRIATTQGSHSATRRR